MAKCIIFLVGPSAVGKTEVRKHLTAIFPECKFIPSFTTRPQRPGETNGEDYFFISDQEFTRLQETSDLLESEEHFGRFYGISKDECNRLLAESAWLVKEIQIDGYLQAKENLNSEIKCFSIFVEPDNLERVIERIAARGGEDIKARIESIHKEMKSMSLCDFKITSTEGNLNGLKKQAESIVIKIRNEI